jgi:ribosomally synthesized peptide (two-chain TOMM family)
MYSNPFPELRSGYLRAIARAWRDEKFRQALFDSKSEKYGALGILKQEFGTNFPYKIKLVIAQGSPGPTYMPQGTRGWIGVEDGFTIYIPCEDKPPAHAADVLARYYQERPTPLGRPDGDIGTEAIPSAFAQFGGMTMRAVALTWEDAEFRRKLIDHGAPGKRRTANEVFEDYLDYQIPWNFGMCFKAQPYPQSDKDWEDFPINEIELILPQRPKQHDGVVEAVALAAYNGTGPQYPFTCG